MLDKDDRHFQFTGRNSRTMHEKSISFISLTLHPTHSDHQYKRQKQYLTYNYQYYTNQTTQTSNKFDSLQSNISENVSAVEPVVAYKITICLIPNCIYLFSFIYFFLVSYIPSHRYACYARLVWIGLVAQSKHDQSLNIKITKFNIK